MRVLRLDELTIEQKIGQMLLCRQPLDIEDKDFVIELIKNRSLGGIHIKNTPEFSVQEFVDAADYPLLICENMEYGFSEGKAKLPCPLAIGATDSEELAYEFGRITAIEAKNAGYNVVFGPVADIAMNPLSCCVGPRAFGGDKERVARMMQAVVRGYQDQGMIVSAKHFPGFGESAVDSHLGMVYLEPDEEGLVERELYPYIKAIKDADLSGVMVGHIMVPKVDSEYPASLSKKLIGLLRKSGYKGITMTDSLAMVGLTNHYGLEECHCLAMEAGIDMVMTSYRIPAKQAYEYLLNAYRSGRVTEAQIDEAVSRIIVAQEKTMKQPEQLAVSECDINLAKKMSSESITVVAKDDDDITIDTDEKHLFIVQVANKFVNPETGKVDEEHSGLDNIERLIRERFPNSDILCINSFPSTSEMENAAKVTMDYESIVMVLYNKTDFYTGSSDLTRRILALFDAVAHKVSTVLSFGNPYAAREYPPVTPIIFGYEGGNCEEAAIDVLTGKARSKGKMPVDLQLRGE